jgi:hypothetical protein
MVVGCIGVPLLVFAGLLVLAVPRAIDWVEARSIATTTGEQEPLEPGTETTPEGAQPTREVAELGAADQEQTPGLAEEEVAADGAESPAAETTPEPDPPTPNQSVSETPREPDRPPTQRPRDERSQQQAGRSSSPSRTTPPASRPTTPAVTEPATEPRAEPEPSRTVPAPADPPVERQVPFDSELDGGLRVSLVVEPEDAFVLLRSSYDERYTVVGMALEFDATKRRGAPLALPSDGTFYVMLRAEGFADHVVKVNASPARGAVATFSLKMGRPGQRAGSAPGQASVIEVRQGITFGDGPRRAKVEVDGEDMGQLRRFQDGGLLPLGPGRHRVVVSLGSQRWELEVNVTSAASSERQVVRIGASD